MFNIRFVCLYSQTGHKEDVRLKSIVGDIRQFDQVLEATKGVDTVIHSLSLIDVSMFPDVAQLEIINVKGNLHLKLEYTVWQRFVSVPFRYSQT